ncbi:MAG: hypothetical protein WBB07_27475 [Mycobacterium sp.]
MNEPSSAEGEPPEVSKPSEVSVTATDNSVAIANVGAIENLHLNAQSVQLHVQSTNDRPPSAVPNAVNTADAVLLGPLAFTEAQALLDAAKELVADEPSAALELYREVQNRLRTAGFPGHAAEFDHRVAALCVRTGEEDTALRLVMDALWAAETAGDSRRAGRVLGMVKDLAGLPDFGPTGSQQPRTPALGAAVGLTQFVSEHMNATVPEPIELPSAVALVNVRDRARAILFAAERALGNDDLSWLADNRGQISTAASEIASSDIDVAVRLRLALADSTGEWADLLTTPTGVRRDLKALILARHARHQLNQAAPIEADATWHEAVGVACLAERHIDAADWLYSQRFVSNRYVGPLEDTWHLVAQALSDLQSKPRIIPAANEVRERALSALHHNNHPVAAINLRRFLLEAIRSASFHDEREARSLLGEIYCDTGQPVLAATYAIGAGDYKQAQKIAEEFGDEYHDVTELMQSRLSWEAASALQFAKVQADLVPDDELDTVVELALKAIHDVNAGTRLDSPVLSPQMHLSAYGLLAALAPRLSDTHAAAVLDLLADSVAVKKHHYRRTDDSHVKIAASITRTKTGELGARALEQLIGLYERGAHPFGDSARDTLVANLDQISDRLQQIANDGNHEAAALLALKRPQQVSIQAAEAAARNLLKPTTNQPSRFGIGTNAISDSILAATLPAKERVACIEMLLSNAGSLWEPSSNRDDYLLAASNLVDDLDEDIRRGYFERAMGFASDPPPSNADAVNQSMSSPLGTIRVNDGSDSRPAATYLAGRLANSDGEKQAVRDLALSLIGVGTDDDWRITKALQLVQAELGDSIGLLAHGSWTLRSLAAILWAESTTMPDTLGIALSRDSDVRVRRAMARAVVRADHRQQSEVRKLLLRDPRWPVRSILRRTDDPDV